MEERRGEADTRARAIAGIMKNHYNDCDEAQGKEIIMASENIDVPGVKGNARQGVLPSGIIQSTVTFIKAICRNAKNLRTNY